MCLLSLYFQASPQAPLLLAAHREEDLRRSALPPAIQRGHPRVLCGTDQLAGGTWLGVNEFGVVVVVTNRRGAMPPANARSRGQLCRDLLAQASARDAAQLAQREVATGKYTDANYLCADALYAMVVSGPQKQACVELTSGRHLLGNTELDDPDDLRLQLASARLPAKVDAPPAEFLNHVGAILSDRDKRSDDLPLVVRAGTRGTVSSTLIALTREPAEAIYCYAPGPPDVTDYEDYSELLRDILDLRFRM